MRSGCRSLAAKCDGLQSPQSALIFRRHRREARPFSTNSTPILRFCPNELRKRNVIGQVMTALSPSRLGLNPPISRINCQDAFENARQPSGAPGVFEFHPMPARPQTPGTSISPLHSPTSNQQASRPPLDCGNNIPDEGSRSLMRIKFPKRI